MQEIVLKRGKDRRLRQGHLWVFGNEIETDTGAIEPGSLVDVFDADGRFAGRGYINPHSLISVRILTRRIQDIDSRFFKRRIDGALKYRRAIYPGEETFRLIHGAGDLIPGLIVDKYDDHIVVQASTLGIDRLLPIIVRALDELLRPAVIIARNDSKAREPEELTCERQILKGEPNPDLVVEIGALKFKVDPFRDQKTGLFLDQRENYSRLEELAKSTRVLDCFCYSGGWGLHAAYFGAREVLGVDRSPDALERARFNAQINSLPDCTFRQADAFETLAEFDSSGERFDIIILDPPAFAKSRNNLTRAMRAYKKINLRAMRILQPDGILITSSCSYHLSRRTFLDMLRSAASAAGHSFRILEYRTQSRDHPILLSVGETAYLKCAFLRVA